MLIGMVLVANPRKITLRAMEIITKTKEIVILNGFQKKTEKTPKKEIIKALQLKYNYEKENEYYNT